MPVMAVRSPMLRPQRTPSKRFQPKPLPHSPSKQSPAALLSAGQFVLEGIGRIRRHLVYGLVDGLSDLRNDIGPVTAGNAPEQIANCRADCHFSIIMVGKIPVIILI